MTIKILHNDCRLALQQPFQVDAIITDPPYEMGFMGKAWDKTGIAYDVEMWKLCLNALKPGGHLLAFGGARTYHRMVCAIEDAGFQIRDQIMWIYGSGFPKHKSLLKPAHEPIVLAKKPGKSVLNIDACRVEGRERTEYGLANATRSKSSTYGKPSAVADFDSTKGRWPANVIHDGGEEVEAEFAKAGDRNNTKKARIRTAKSSDFFFGSRENTGLRDFGDSGTAARFFYCAKASKKERNGSQHPTVKPLALMRYLCKLITPPNGTILDPFAGTGTTGEAALLEGFNAILIEQDIKYIEDIKKRIDKADNSSNRIHNE